MPLENRIKILFLLLALLSVQQSVFAQVVCFKDTDCSAGNCVFFLCKPQGCRSDTDCSNWGYGSHFCINSKAPFFGTQCVQKRTSGQICFGNNECQSGTCNWYLLCA